MELPQASVSIDEVRDDFNQIALLPDTWDHNSWYHRFLLRHVPPGCSHALEIGCGTGRFTCLLAQRARQVTALDLSPVMIQRARQRAAAFPNVQFLVADASSWPYPEAAFDFVVSIATLHHLPASHVLPCLGRAMTPGGVLVILDLVEYPPAVRQLHNCIAAPIAAILRMAHTGRIVEPRATRRAWRQHGRRERYLTPSQLRHTILPLLPGSRLRLHVLWRHSLVWRKPWRATDQNDRIQWKGR